MKVERELKSKGYRLVKLFNNKEEAKEYAKRKRSQGYYARIVTYTDIAGIDYGVWVKEKVNT